MDEHQKFIFVQTRNYIYLYAGVVSILTTPVLDHETQSTFLVEVIATDDYGLSSSENLTIYVTDANDAPILALPGTISIPENSEGGTSIYNVTVTDADGDVITYDIVTTGPFVISSSGNTVFVHILFLPTHVTII